MKNSWSSFLGLTNPINNTQIYFWLGVLAHACNPSTLGG